MRLRSFVLSALLLCSVCLSVFLGGSIDVSAAVSGGTYLSYADAVAIFGQTISVRYYDGSDYVDASASLVGQDSVIIYYADTDADSMYNGAPYIYYELSGITVSSNPNYIQVRTNPSYSILGTDQIHTFIAVSGGRDIPVSVYSNDRWDWNFQYFENNVYDTDRYGTEYHSQFRCNQGWFSYVPIDATFNSPTDIYCLEANFYGNSVSNGSLYIAVGIPYVSTSASGAAGALTTDPSGGSGGGSGDINVTVDVDMEETNGLLGDIKGILNGIVDGIKNLFIPSEESLTVFKTNMQELLAAHLGGLYEAIDIIDGLWSEFESVSAKSSIDIPVCNIPLAGEVLQLGGWSVPLKVQGMPAILYESIAFIIDFLAAAAFINMCRNKLEIFLNPDSEVVQNDN